MESNYGQDEPIPLSDSFDVNYNKQSSLKVPRYNVGDGYSNHESCEDYPPYKYTKTSLPHIDYVLLYEDLSAKNDEESLKKEKNRKKFLNKLQTEGIQFQEFENKPNSQEGDGGSKPQEIDGESSSQQIQYETIPKQKFLVLYVPFDRLAKEAEAVNLPMPLENCELHPEYDCMEMLERKYLVTDNEVDYIAAPFECDKADLFKGYKDGDTFFRSSLRNYLTHHILIHTDIRGAENRVNKNIDKKALPRLLHDGVFLDAFQLHDPSVEDRFMLDVKKMLFLHYKGMSKCATHDSSKELEYCPGLVKFQQSYNQNSCEAGETSNFGDKQELARQHATIHAKVDIHFQFKILPDDRQDMHENWFLWTKYQPLWKVRNYFGENIAFYFAWLGHLMSFLWLPLFVGLAVFFYGIYERVSNLSTNTTTTNSSSNTGTKQFTDTMDQMLYLLRGAFDNRVTPFYAIGICIWSTILTEYWKRYRIKLAYLWDVEDFEYLEPDRPAFRGTVKRQDEVTQKEEFHFPFTHQLLRFSISFIVLLVMILIVFIAVVGVIVYRIVITVKVCPQITSTQCLIVNSIVSSFLNAIAILILGLIYNKVARILTDWENHRTETDYQDALIIKLFAFEFVNSYSSLVYIAFFRGNNAVSQTQGIFGMGSEYIDNCGINQTCMSMLSLQVLILMITLPFPKFLLDIILPLLKKLFRYVHNRCTKCIKRVGPKQSSDSSPTEPTDLEAFIKMEYNKPPLDNFPLEEYMEKVIQYGYLALFAASFPLAPLIAQALCFIDKHVDAKRMLWMYRRPVSWMASDIGMWEPIVDFVNICSVVSNAFLFAFTSTWASTYDLKDKLLIVIGVEHTVFLVKIILSALIPDIPRDVQLAMRKEHYRVAEIMERHMKNKKE